MNAILLVLPVVRVAVLVLRSTTSSTSRDASAVTQFRSQVPRYVAQAVWLCHTSKFQADSLHYANFLCRHIMLCDITHKQDHSINITLNSLTSPGADRHRLERHVALLCWMIMLLDILQQGRPVQAQVTSCGAHEHVSSCARARKVHSKGVQARHAAERAKRKRWWPNTASGLRWVVSARCTEGLIGPVHKKIPTTGLEPVSQQWECRILTTYTKWDVHRHCKGVLTRRCVSTWTKTFI